MLFFILHTLFIMSMTILIVSTFCFNISSKSISISGHGFSGFFMASHIILSLVGVASLVSEIKLAYGPL